MMIITRRGRGALRHAGFMIIELVVTALLLAIAMTVTVKVLGWVAHERRDAERRQLAVLEVGNIMERFAARPFDELTADSARGFTLTEPARLSLPGAELNVSVEGVDGPRPAKRLAVRIRWQARAGIWAAPVRVMAWAYKQEVHR
jgi:Tfp pilus assembly protein PilV